MTSALQTFGLEMRYGRSLYRSAFFEDYVFQSWSGSVHHSVQCSGLDGYDCPTSSCEMAREVDLGLMHVLFRFHYATVVHVAVMNHKLLYSSADSQSEELPRVRRKAILRNICPAPRGRSCASTCLYVRHSSYFDRVLAPVIPHSSHSSKLNSMWKEIKA